jgi:peptidoglycan/xylan/chitin deacetylase (PgdA/CDA1 family)
MKFKVGLAITAASFLMAAGLSLFLKFLLLIPIFSYGPIIFFVIVEALLLWGILDHKSPLFGRVFWRGPKKLRLMSLTFDDGPTEPYTSSILDILKKYQVKATFFVLGRKVELYPEAVKKIVADGHEIGNHGYDHKVLPLKSLSGIKAEIKRTEDLILSLTGKKPALFRAPHGWKRPCLKKALREAGYELVSWTAGVWDTDRPGEQKIIRRSLKTFRNGAILLFHDGRGLEENADCSQLVAALPAIIESALSQGFQFMTVSQLLELSRTPTERRLRAKGEKEN